MAIESYFGVADRARHDPHGKILNPIPLWTNDKYIQDLKNDIRLIEQQENEGFLSAKERATKLARKTKKETILRLIKDSDPRNRLSEFDKDKVKNVKDSLLMKIKGISPYLQDDPKKPSEFHGVETNPQEEGNKSKQPCIRIDTDDEFAEAKRANLRMTKVSSGNGKPVYMVSRDDATRACRLLALALGMRMGYQSFRNRMPFGRKGTTVGYEDPIYGEKFDKIFNPDNVIISRAEYERLIKAGEKAVVPTIVTKPVKKKKPSKKLKAKRTGTPWTCPDCDFEGTTLEKGFHRMKFHPKKENVKEKEPVLT